MLIVAGEASGDMHGAALIDELRKIRPGLAFYGIGGDAMRKAGVELVFHARQMSFLGFLEVLKHVPFIRRVFKTLSDLLKSRRPDIAVLIDYPGFNLRLAGRIRKHCIPVFYYISPQVWAWGRGRVRQMAERIDRIAVIFPFEESIYRQAGIPVRYVGHPLKDQVKVGLTKSDFFRELDLKPKTPLVGLLPGSRKQEVGRLLPVMVEAFRILQQDIPDLHALVGMAPTLTREDYVHRIPAGLESVRLVEGKTYEIMAHSDAVMVASGTATLETAILGTPMVILYKMAPISYLLSRLLVKIKYIGLVNIVSGKSVVPELVQGEARPRQIADAVRPLLLSPKETADMRRELKAVSDKLGTGGASTRTAEWIMDMLDAA